MATNKRSYPQQTVKRLYALSGNQCAFPGCTATLVNSENASNSHICHIEAANESGPRFNSALTVEQRNDYTNLILLCPSHHAVVDAHPEEYSVERLKEMKQSHERAMVAHRQGLQPSMLLLVVNALASLDFSQVEPKIITVAFSPADKIRYNELKAMVPLIEDYKVYHAKINALYDELDAAGSIKKARVLDAVRAVYLRVKGRHVLGYSDQALEIVRKNSDTIFNEVFEELYNGIESTSEWKEDLEFGLRIVLVDAFIRCKIMEEPR